MRMKIKEILDRSVCEVIEYEELRQKLLSGKQLRIKLGIDPTSPNIHLGRSVPLLKLKDFQDMGHKIVLVIGDFTGAIGDTSDKDAERPMLSQIEVKNNMKTYIEQCGKILDIKKIEIHHNSQWLKGLTYHEIARQANLFSLTEFIRRENIDKRLNAGKRISLRELLYPLMQGYDSVAIKSDVEIGGRDQRFNLLAGRVMQREYNQEPQNILMTNLILGLDGRKMSSSWGNTINILDEPKNMFGKVMSMRDEMIIPFMINCTRIATKKIELYQKQINSSKVNPRDIKLELAREITKMYWSAKGMSSAELHFNSVIRNKEIPDDVPVCRVNSYNIVDILVQSNLADSKTNARRLIKEGAIYVNKKKIKDANYQVNKGSTIQKGRKGNFRKIL